MFWKQKPADLPSPQQLHEKLLRYLPITPEDIALNRQGRLSEAQQQEYGAMIKKGQNAALILVPLVLLVAIGGIGWQLLGNENMGGGGLKDVVSQNPLIPIVGIGGSLLLYVLLIVYSFVRAKGSAATLKVHSAAGKIKLKAYEAHGMGMSLVSASGVNTRSIMVQIGRQKIYATNPAVEDALENGGNYRIYFIKMSGIGYFVSAEVESDA